MDILVILFAICIVLNAVVFSISKKSEINAKKESAVKNELLTVLAHDLIGPYSVMLGFGNEFLENYHTLKDEERLEYLEILLYKLTKSHNLLNNVLVWVKLNREGYEVENNFFHIVKLVHEVVDSLQIFIKKNNQNLKISGDINTVVFSDLNFFRIIIKNLIENAMKYTNPGGTIEIIVCDNPSHHLLVISNTFGSKNILPYSNKENSKSNILNQESYGFGIGISKKLLQTLKVKFVFKNIENRIHQVEIRINKTTP
ncbi:sensor histidine kinase [Seonamhaeicola sp. ML3]|uniref:ATP-binding protein n=1 Tax=Seonamhaeicola sp. ML3 TaxID=2937786 RepID=UPI00200E6BB8|nr:sensor histidine kinase [Seonamhaeicola sp. ML3]